MNQLFKVKCKFCDQPFLTNDNKHKYCPKHSYYDFTLKWLSEKRKLINDEKYKDRDDLPTCKICGYKARILLQHLKRHNLTPEQYMEEFGVDKEAIYHKSYLENVKENGKGKIVKCPECGTEFAKTAPKQTYCSKKCSDAVNERNKVSDAQKRTRIRKITCRQCGKEFRNNKKSNVRYCSTTCRNKYLYLKKRGEAKHLINCRVCNKDFMSHQKNRSTCSVKCKKKLLKMVQLQTKIKRSQRVHEHDKLVPTCQICGFRSKNLHAHIRVTHKMTAERYCKKFKIDKKELMHPDLRENHIRSGKRNYQKELEDYLNSEEYRDSQRTDSVT